MAFIEYVASSTIDGEILITWRNVSGLDECQSYRVPKATTQLVMQAKGSFPAGSGVVMTGSNEDQVYSNLQDGRGNTARLRSPGIIQITALPFYVKPIVRGATADITISITSRLTI